MRKTYKDIVYTVQDGVVRITIHRPEVYNAFRSQTLEGLIDALRRADAEHRANVTVLAGAGEKAFCTGGDQKVRLSEDGLYGPRGTVGMPIEEMQTALRDLRKVSITRVQGFAIGRGNVFATICDITLASEKANFGQVGPQVGSVDPGWGTAHLAMSRPAWPASPGLERRAAELGGLTSYSRLTGSGHEPAHPFSGAWRAGLCAHAQR